jgi:hypothetical protein
MRRTLAALLAIAAASSPVDAQPAQRVDSGTLTMTSNTPMGTRVSTEDFTIVRNADGGFTIMSVTSGGRQMRTVLNTDSLGNPTAYEHHGRGGETVEKTITSRRDETGAMVMTELSSRNPPRAPLRFPPNTIILGDGSMAQYWVLGLGTAPRELSVFGTGPWRASSTRLSNAGTESVIIEGTAVAATHFVLGDGTMRREVWLDSQKRLLKAALGENSVAVRTTLPK